MTAVDDDGKLYDALIETNPQTAIVGLGSPGKGSSLGVDETAASANEGASETSQQTVSLSSEGSEAKSVMVSGMPAGQIVLIALAAAIVALVSFAAAVRRRRNIRNSKLVESNVSEDIEAREVIVEEWVDEDDGGYIGQVHSPTSSLAAMGVAGSSTLMMSDGVVSTRAADEIGVASTVATRLSTGETEVMMMEKQPWTKNEPEV